MNPLQRKQSAALALSAVMVVGIFLVHFSRDASSAVGIAGWTLIGLALLISLLGIYRNSRLFIGIIGLALMFFLTLFFPAVSTSSTTNLPSTFTLDVTKIRSDLSSLPANGNVEVVLLVNNIEYRFDAQIYQLSMKNTGTPIPCSTGLPNSATVTPIPSLSTSPTPTALAATPSPGKSTPTSIVIPLPTGTAVPSATASPIVASCLNSAVNTISVTLNNPDPSMIDSFTNQLPNVTSIYLLPRAATPTPGATHAH